MMQNLSDREIHARYCPLTNTKSALFLVVSFSVMAFVGWKGLHKGSEAPSVVVLLFAIVVVAMLAKSLASFTCFRERLVIGLVIVSLAIGEVKAFAPSVFGRHVEIAKYGKLALLLLGLLVSLTMFVQSAGGPKFEPDEAPTSNPVRPKQNLLIFLTIISTILILGAMLYFLPLR